jgi:hypothetical protein
MREYSEETDRRIFVDVTWDIYCTADIYWFAPFCFTSQEKGNFWFSLIFSLVEKKTCREKLLEQNELGAIAKRRNGG